MALVYRAIDQNTGHNVAIKVLKRELSQDSDYVIRFQREAEAASKMTHHNIVNLLDVGMDGADRYLVMEYVQGITLKELIHQKGRLPAATAAQICIRILSALQHAHSQGIIHRDIKPQNILVANDGHVKVSDFGIARIANSYTLTKDDSVMGTVYYYSPEQASGQKVEATSDIYSTGIVLYEMLTGRVPFTGDTQVAIAMQHLKARPVPIEQLAPDVPPAVIRVCMRAMAKQPSNRYQTARDMATDLHMALQGRVGEMQPELPEDTAYTPPARKEPPRQPQKQAQPKKTGPAHPGQVTRQRKKPEPRTLLRWAATALVSLIVCYGLWIGCQSIIEQVTNSTQVPDLVGMDVSTAERTATRQGLYIEIIEANHATVPAGTLFQQEPEADTTIRKGSTVRVTMSMGPASLTVPTVVGSTLSDAISQAQAMGLTITVVSYEVSEEVQAGKVMSQIPDPGTACQAGDIIQVKVSGGLVNIPDVRGSTLAAARETLTNAGLNVSGSVSYRDTTDTSQHGLVAAQSPTESTAVIQGTTVYLTLYQVPGLTKSAEVMLSLPERNETLSVRVTLVVDGMETTMVQMNVEPEDSRHPIVTLTTQIAGDYTYRVYLNGSFAYQETATLE